MRSYFIIEHPTRGVLRVTSTSGKPSWSWAAPRSDPDNMRSYSLDEAVTTLADYVPPPDRDQCVIRRSPEPPEIEWEVVADAT